MRDKPHKSTQDPSEENGGAFGGRPTMGWRLPVPFCRLMMLQEVFFVFVRVLLTMVVLAVKKKLGPGLLVDFLLFIALETD